MTIVVRFILTALVLLFVPNPVMLVPHHISMPDLAAIDQYVEVEMQRDRVPGVALAIVHNNQIVSLRGYGTDGNGRPVTPATGFLLGSMSKSFTALAVMQLVERGQIRLDSPAITYLPWFHTADANASAQISVRHLLNHTRMFSTLQRQFHHRCIAFAVVDVVAIADTDKWIDGCAYSGILDIKFQHSSFPNWQVVQQEQP